MGKTTHPSRRHVASGIEAVVESAHHATADTFDDVWVDATDLARAIDKAKDLSGDSEVNVHSSESGRYAIRLRI